MERKVAIIGAGISGLLACKYTLSKGFHPIVFEAKSNLGGVWTKTIETTRLQTPKVLYQFSDFPWPSSVIEDFPKQHQVFDYMQSYAHHFDLLRHIKFNTKVVSVEYEGLSEEEMQSWTMWSGTDAFLSSKGKWKLMVEDTSSLSTEPHQRLQASSLLLLFCSSSDQIRLLLLLLLLSPDCYCCCCCCYSSSSNPLLYSSALAG